MRKLIVYWLMTALAMAVAMSAAYARAAPSDAPSFTRYVGERLHASNPDVEVTVKADLALEAKAAAGEKSDISLTRLYDFCQRQRSHCDGAVEQFVASATEVMRERATPVDVTRIRLALRPVEYVEQVRRQVGPGAVFSRPLAPGLVIVPVVDLARTARAVSKADLESARLSEDELYDLGLRNLRSAQQPLAEIAPIPKADSIGTLRGDDYAASRLCFPEDWGPIAERLGTLIVMAPTPDLVLYGEGGTPQAVDALRTLGAHAANQTPRHLPPVVLRWTPQGWEPLK